MATDNTANDISDIRPANTSGQSFITLPIRGEKRIIPTVTNPNVVSSAFSQAYRSSGQIPPTNFAPGRSALVEESDFNVSAAISPLVEYVLVRIPNRGITATGTPMAAAPPAVYRFLINPSDVSVSRTTLDGQAMTRAGWQIGVWGEDSLQITLSGKSAGQYFAFGLTDRYQAFTESYRNLAQLQTVFENNGYWFEGEQVNEGPLAADFTRRRIKMHNDVELIVGNFMWYGMFDSLQLSQTADTPFLMNFEITFVAWKERFRSGSPYQNSITNNVERGHSYTAWAATTTASSSGVPTSTPSTPLSQTPPALTNQASVTQGGLISPTAQAAQQQNILGPIDPTAQDFSFDPSRSNFSSIGIF